MNHLRCPREFIELRMVLKEFRLILQRRTNHRRCMDGLFLVESFTWFMVTSPKCWWCDKQFKFSSAHRRSDVKEDLWTV